MEKTKSVRRRVDSGKLMKLKEELNQEREKSEDYLNRLRYLQADFENFRKRVEKEAHQVAQYANERLIVNLLDVIDDLEMAVQTGKRTENKDALLEGVQMVCKKLCATLEREGLTGIESVGKLFDPKMHEVLIKVPTKDYEEGVIIEEVRKGFMLREKVIRPSIVKIASSQGVIEDERKEA